MKSKTFQFNSAIQVIGAMPSFTQDQIKNEPMFYNADAEYASEHGGPITKYFVERLYDLFHWDVPRPMVIDTRSHMLMKGFYPCIPGWHHDDVPRSRADGQPNYNNPEYHAQHYMALVNGDICPTEFALGKCEMPDFDEGEVCYRKWHPLVDELCDSGKLQRYEASGNPIIQFDAHSFHRGTQARESGWRWFGRASMSTDRLYNTTNEIRNQVQVYIPAPDYRGW